MIKKVYRAKISNVLILYTLSIVSTEVRADEWLTQFYIGDAFTQKHDAQVNLPDAGISATHKALAFDSAIMIGLRETYWFSFCHYLGLGFDVTHFFGPNQKEQDSLTTLCINGDGCSTPVEHIQKFNNNVTTLGLDFAFRYSLRVRQQQLQPYVAVGPALFTAQLQDTTNFIPAEQSSASTSIGIKAYGGLLLSLSKHFGAFLEYQYNSFQAKTDYYNARVAQGITLGTTLGQETFTMHSVVGGVSLSY